MSMKACTSCKKVSTNDRCPLCNNPTSINWSGLLIITDPENSKIAKELNIVLPGEYALRVR